MRRSRCLLPTTQTDIAITRWGSAAAIAAAVYVFGSYSLSRSSSGLLHYSAIPLTVSTLAFIDLLRRVRAAGENVTTVTVSRLCGWAICVGVVSIFAQPDVSDFWVSIGFGDMIAHGINPYYHDLSHVYLQRLPLDLGGGFEQKMTYGPLWAAAVGALMFVSRSVMVAAVLCKLLLGGAWVGSLALIRRMVRREPNAAGCAAMLVFGWLPLSVRESVANGHVDIIATLGVIAWLAGTETGRRLPANLALAGSVLVKYASAPLVFVSLLFDISERSSALERHKPVWAFVIPALAGGAILALFARDIAFFAPLWHTLGLSGFGFAEALSSIWPGHVASAIAWAARLAIAAIAVRALVHLRVKPSAANRRYAALAVMTAVFFASGAHLEPWYLVALVGLAALGPETRLASWVIGVALAFPFGWLWFQLGEWWPVAGGFRAAALTYLGAFAWMWLDSRFQRNVLLRNHPAEPRTIL